MVKAKSWLRFLVLVALVVGLVGLPVYLFAASPSTNPVPVMKHWWAWPLGLFGCCTLMGALSIFGGIGVGILFLTLLAAFSPIHIDFIRFVALLLALVSALIAAPGLLRRDLADLHLALPPALCSATGALLGSYVGFKLSTETLYVALGGISILVAFFVLFSSNVRQPSSAPQDRISVLLGMSGVYQEHRNKEAIAWAARKTLPALVLFFLAGCLTGIFGLDVGWASVSLFNLVMGIPLKVAIGTGKFLSCFANTSAGWVYFNHGCLIPLIAVPSVAGLIAGSFLAIELHGLMLNRIKLFRLLAFVLIIIAGVKMILKGLLA